MALTEENAVVSRAAAGAKLAILRIRPQIPNITLSA
jgi:hypothetical protein